MQEAEAAEAARQEMVRQQRAAKRALLKEVPWALLADNSFRPSQANRRDRLFVSLPYITLTISQAEEKRDEGRANGLRLDHISI